MIKCTIPLFLVLAQVRFDNGYILHVHVRFKACNLRYMDLLVLYQITETTIFTLRYGDFNSSFYSMFNKEVNVFTNKQYAMKGHLG